MEGVFLEKIPTRAKSECRGFFGYEVSKIAIIYFFNTYDF